MPGKKIKQHKREEVADTTIRSRIKRQRETELVQKRAGAMVCLPISPRPTECRNRGNGFKIQALVR